VTKETALAPFNLAHPVVTMAGALKLQVLENASMENRSTKTVKMKNV